MGTPRTFSKKQVVELVAKGGSLADADIRGLDLAGICFDGIDLEMAKLAECNLARSTFRNANLKLASLWSADCRDAIFDGADLEEADLDFTELDGASFHNAKVKKAIFPFARVSFEQVTQSVKTGKRLRMERASGDEL